MRNGYYYKSISYFELRITKYPYNTIILHFRPQHKDVITLTKLSDGHDILSHSHKLICHGREKN